MKVLHVNYTDRGGAFIALKRIDEALLLNFKEEYSSSYLIINPINGYKSNYIPFIKNKLHKLINFVRPRIVRVTTNLIFKPSVAGNESYNVLPHRKIVNFINNSGFDLVHLHWIGGETLSIRDFKRIKKPIIWTLHDSWAYLGRHHFKNIKDKITTEKYIDSYLRKLKKNTWNDMGMQVICVSSWLKKEVYLNNIFLIKNIIQIHNTIDTLDWFPIIQKVARDFLNLDSNKTYLCLGAINPDSDHRKGFSLLADAVKLLPSLVKNKTEILMFGSTAEDISLSGIKVRLLGEITDEFRLKNVYAASDVILVPSYLESFGQTALEAIAMEKPVVCFDSSGTTDIVKHLKNGYVAKSYSIEDFCEGIIWAIHNCKSLEVKKYSRQFSIDNFDYSVISKQYYEVYERQINS
jgi:glycosyltransferase involved in cell wall biosynthesis